jgi:hypothetical protein
VAGLALFLLPLVVIGPLARRTMQASLFVRALWTGGTASLVGLALGMLFPAGLRYVERDQGVPIALAVNGVTSVLGGAAAIIVSVAFGIPASFALAALCYLTAGIAGPLKWQEYRAVAIG